MLPVIKYYRTKFEGKTDDRFAMLAELLAADCPEMGGRTPRVLHFSDRVYHGCYYLQCIVVWEQQSGLHT